MSIFAQIQRPGADKLLAWLEMSDFFTAPASSRFHSSHEGGLCEHSVKVYDRLKEQNELLLRKKTSEKEELEKNVDKAIGKSVGDTFELSFEGGDGMYTYIYTILEIIPKD
jgi:23S rRNA maturation-related 3'-5' exoribonuclease YhaM